MSELSLKELMVPVVEAWFDVDAYEGFSVKLAYLTKDEVNKIRNKATNNKFSRKTRGIEENIDMELFQDMYIKAILKDWKGLKYSYLEQMIPVDLSNIEDWNECLSYNTDNAIMLMKNCDELDSFITDNVGELGNFIGKATKD